MGGLDAARTSNGVVACEGRNLATSRNRGRRRELAACRLRAGRQSFPEPNRPCSRTFRRRWRSCSRMHTSPGKLAHWPHCSPARLPSIFEVVAGVPSLQSVARNGLVRGGVRVGPSVPPLTGSVYSRQTQAESRLTATCRGRSSRGTKYSTERAAAGAGIGPVLHSEQLPACSGLT